MPSRIVDTVFSEPSGRPTALVQVAGALVFSGLYVYYGLLRNGTPGSWLLVMALASTLSGVAESLPSPRRRAAGVLRLTGIVLLVALLVSTVLAPDVLLG